MSSFVLVFVIAAMHGAPAANMRYVLVYVGMSFCYEDHCKNSTWLSWNLHETDT